MKRIIGGTAYNTETATRIAAGGGATLYQTRYGDFFICRASGELLDLTPAAARTFLKQHAPDQKIVAEPARRWTIRLPEALARRVEQAAADARISVNTYLMRVLEDALD